MARVIKLVTMKNLEGSPWNLRVPGPKESARTFTREKASDMSPKPRPTVHNVLFVQYIFLATEQAQTYRKSCSLIYLVTYICPSAFDCEENAFFRIFVKSNSKSGRFSSFLMPNNFGTGQKKAYFLGTLEN